MLSINSINEVTTLLMTVLNKLLIYPANPDAAATAYRATDCKYAAESLDRTAKQRWRHAAATTTAEDARATK